DADAPHDSRGQSVAFKTRPACAAIGGFVEPAAGAAAVEAPRRAIDLPKRSKERAGVVGIKNHGDRAGLVVLIEDFLPGCPAVSGAEDPALLVRPVCVPKCGHENHIRVPGVDNHGADVPRVLQANVLPGLAGVDRFVNAVAVADVAADTGLARSD